MCIEYSRGTLPELLTADEDVTVYKVVIVDEEQRLVPPFASQLYQVRDFFYEKNVPKEQELLLEAGMYSHPTVTNGLFSFEEYSAANDFIGNNCFFDRDNRYHMYKAIIPKGAQYYKGPWDGLAVVATASNKLILTELVASCYGRNWEMHPTEGGKE